MTSEASQGQLRLSVDSVIRLVRGEKVILDTDLALIYGVPTGALNRAVKRNVDRFPEDFVFQVTTEEAAALRCQSGISKTRANAGGTRIGRGGRRYLPYAFTEHGALMAANVLSSPRAIQMAVFVVRAFVRMRRAMAAHKEMDEKLSDMERRVMGHDEAIRSLVQTIRQLMAPPKKARRSIGFKVEEARPVYRRPRRRNAR
jgi:hypothetical protein